MKAFKKGDKVKMVNCIEASDKTWVCSTDAQEMCGSQVVWLVGYKGCFDCDNLELVD